MAEEGLLRRGTAMGMAVEESDRMDGIEKHAIERLGCA